LTVFLSKAGIREHLQKIIESDEDSKSPRNQKFLAYIVEKTLAVEQDRLKGYSIGVDVFERGDDFDSQADSIVRVQAGKLRKALELYYLTTGKTDNIKIGMVSGSYVPQFSLADRTSMPTPKQSETEMVARGPQRPVYWKPRYLYAVIFFFAGIIATTAVIFSSGKKVNSNVVDQALIMPQGPSISVLPFDIVGDEDRIVGGIKVKSLRIGLQIETVGKISRFKNLRVKEVVADANQSALESARAANTQYMLTGSIQVSDDIIRIASLLTRTTSGEILWAKSYDVATDRGIGLLETQSSIAIDVATSLGQPTSSINTKLIAEQRGLDAIQLNHYCCLMQFYDYTNKLSADKHWRIRKCLEKATTELPAFSSGWAALSRVYSDEWHNQFNLRAADEPAAERALGAARRGVTADPENAMAHQYLAMAEFLVGNEHGFKQAAETALALNPNDTEVLALIGSHLIQLENSDRGKEMVEKAMVLNPGHPSWYHGSIIKYHYTRHDTEVALNHANEYIESDSLAAYFLLAAVLVQDGQIEKAKQVFSTLLEKYPEFANRYDVLLRSRGLPDGMYEQSIGDLVVAGLQVDK
jgi:TolB-like protein/cytochrome c-type biogenesis protein CcmH/NrfG